MAIKERVNDVLHRATGYRLTRATPAVGPSQQEFDEVLRRVRRRQRRQRQRLEKQVAQLTRRTDQVRSNRKQNERLPSYVDEATREIIERSRARTLTGLVKLLPMVEAVRYVADHEIPGAIVECGVWRGGSMQAMAWTLLGAGVNDRDLHLYDTFEGMSEPTEADVQTRTRATAADLLSMGKATCIADLDDVRQGMADTGYPAERVHFHPGKVEDTIPGEIPEQIAVLRLDTDWYESTRHELQHLYPRLVPGGVLIIDDFGSWDGARKATLEWLEETKEPLMLVPIGAARIAVKLR